MSHSASNLIDSCHSITMTVVQYSYINYSCESRRTPYNYNCSHSHKLKYKNGQCAFWVTSQYVCDWQIVQVLWDRTLCSTEPQAWQHVDFNESVHTAPDGKSHFAVVIRAVLLQRHVALRRVLSERFLTVDSNQDTTTSAHKTWLCIVDGVNQEHNKHTCHTWIITNTPVVRGLSSSRVKNWRRPH